MTAPTSVCFLSIDVIPSPSRSQKDMQQPTFVFPGFPIHLTFLCGSFYMVVHCELDKRSGASWLQINWLYCQSTLTPNLTTTADLILYQITKCQICSMKEDRDLGSVMFQCPLSNEVDDGAKVRLSLSLARFPLPKYIQVILLPPVGSWVHSFC